MKTIIIMAQSVDGVIGYNSSHKADWTSPEDKKFFVESTKDAGVIIFGRNTFATFGDTPLPGRLNLVMTINDEDLRKSMKDKVEFVKKEPEEILSDLQKRGFRHIFIGGGSTINGLFLDRQLVNEIWITIEPKVLGSGLRLFSDCQRNLDLRLLKSDRSNQTVILKYEVLYGDTKQE